MSGPSSSTPGETRADIGNFPDVKVDSDGDLILIVGIASGQPAKGFLVCSHSLAQASMIFNTLLYGPMSTCKPTDPSTPWIVRLPDDDPDAFQTMLLLLYRKF